MAVNTSELARTFEDDRFHRSFTLPATSDRPTELKITYSDFGYRNPEDPGRERVVLFCGPLLGSRYLLTTKDKLAQQYGVRIINPDRPGFGGSSEVNASDRVRVWLEMVPALLDHLDIKHVSLVAHSGGAVYAMNTILHLRHLLDPTHPYAAICVPWVHPSHSGVSFLQLANMLPDSLVGTFDKVVHFFNANVGPVVQSSSGFIGNLPILGGGKDQFLAPGVDPEAAELEEKLSPEMFRRVHAENTQGFSQDALLLLKRAEHPGYWGSWTDYDTLVPLLAKAESELSAGTAGASSPLRIDVFFAESDMMIGTGAAPRWFDNCWRREQRGDSIQYNSVVVPKANHDNILDLRYGVPNRVFQEIGGSRND